MFAQVAVHVPVQMNKVLLCCVLIFFLVLNRTQLCDHQDHTAIGDFG